MQATFATYGGLGRAPGRAPYLESNVAADMATAMASTASTASTARGAAASVGRTSLDAHRHEQYCQAARAVGDEHEGVRDSVKGEQQARAHRFAGQQRHIAHVAHDINDSCGQLMRSHGQSQGKPIRPPLVILGQGAGMHKSFKVAGARTTASCATTARRLAARGHIVATVDEYKTSKVECVD